MDKDSSTPIENRSTVKQPKRKSCTAARPNGRLVSDEPRLKRAACTEKQLAALRAGRAKNSRFKPKSADVKTSKDSQ